MCLVQATLDAGLSGDVASKLKKAEQDLVERLQSKADELVKSNDDAAQVTMMMMAMAMMNDGDDEW